MSEEGEGRKEGEGEGGADAAFTFFSFFARISEAKKRETGRRKQPIAFFLSPPVSFFAVVFGKRLLGSPFLFSSPSSFFLLLARPPPRRNLGRETGVGPPPSPS